MSNEFIKDFEKIGKFLLKVELIADWNIEDLSDTHKWAKLVLTLNTNEPQHLEITFDKEYGFITNIEYSNVLDLLDTAE